MTFRINFDYVLSKNSNNSYVQIPKIFQGVDYTTSLKVKDTVTNQYRDFSNIYEIRLQARTSLSSPEYLFEARKSLNHFTYDSNSSALIFNFPSSMFVGVTEEDKVGVASIVELPFVYSMEFLDTNGDVTEIFSHGTGYIVLNPTR